LNQWQGRLIPPFYLTLGRQATQRGCGQRYPAYVDQTLLICVKWHVLKLASLIEVSTFFYFLRVNEDGALSLSQGSASTAEGISAPIDLEISPDVQ